MVIDPSLFVVGSFFFVSVTSALYALSWLLVFLTTYRFSTWLSHVHQKHVLMLALLIPPLGGLIFTARGVTFYHVHEGSLGSGHHHSSFCERVFYSLLAFDDPTILGFGGALIQGAAWLVILIGICSCYRLFCATRQLKAGLAPFLKPPSKKLQRSLLRVEKKLSRELSPRFFECAIPSSYSSVIGIWRPVCVLSEELITSATDSELDAVVAHEAVHIRSQDSVATFIVGALNCFFFYLPPVRRLAQKWREETELVCDDLAVGITRKPSAMAAAILRAAGALNPPPLPATALAFTDESACPLSKRVDRLLAYEKPLKLQLSYAVHAWLGRALICGTIVSLLFSSDAACLAHCVLETLAVAL